MNHGKYAPEDKHGVATASSPAGFAPSRCEVKRASANECLAATMPSLFPKSAVLESWRGKKGNEYLTQYSITPILQYFAFELAGETAGAPRNRVDAARWFPKHFTQ